LVLEFQLFTEEQKRAMLGSEEAARLKSRAAAVDAYTEALKRNEAAQRKRAPLEKERETHSKTLETATAQKTSLENKKSTIKPQLSDSAKSYEANEAKAKELEAKIADLEKTANSKSTIGMSKDGDNKLTRTLKLLEDTKAELASIDRITGKADYDKAF
jgi:chromosome segregation ATPase